MKLKQLSNDTGTSLFVVLLSGFYILLNKMSGQDDIVVGTASENRKHPQTQELIGMFVNTLPLRAKVSSNDKPINFIKYVGNVLSKGKLNEHVFHLNMMVDQLEVERDTSRHPVFQTLFSFETFYEQIILKTL